MLPVLSVDRLRGWRERPREREVEIENSQKATLKNVLTEKDLLDLLGLTKTQVTDLRLNKGLPFIKVNQNSRLYFEDDIIQFFYKSRVILDRDA